MLAPSAGKIYSQPNEKLMCLMMFSDAYSAHVTYEEAEFASVTVAVAAVQPVQHSVQQLCLGASSEFPTFLLARKKRNASLMHD